MSEPLLDVQGLSIQLRSRGTWKQVVSDVSFTVQAGEALGIVGESGSGKTLSMLALLQLLPEGARALAQRARYDGQDLMTRSAQQMSLIRGRDIACVFQDPLSALNPVLPIGRQITEVIQRHFATAPGAAHERAAALLARVGIADPQRQLHQYPHQFSGGMRQRICIAMALAGEPRVLIADEPTTALDVTVQAQIVHLIRELQQSSGLTVIWVTHDLALLARLADRVLVMREGRVVETASATRLFASPQHPYAVQLLRSVRHDLDRRAAVPAALAGGNAAMPVAGSASSPTSLLAAYGITVTYAGKSGETVQALRGVDLEIHRGEVLALVGESGSGKSTLARALVRAIPTSSGTLRFEDRDITTLAGAELRRIRRHFQVVFQDPFGSLNPRLSIGAAIAEPLIVHGLASGRALRERVADCLTLVGLDPACAVRRPREFSGGQRQRICIARAIATRPDLIVADEALSALDPSLRDQILELFQDLKDRCRLTYLFISHDLGVVQRIADRVAVLYLGRVVEIGLGTDICRRPRHPYTQALMAAVPVPDPVAERARLHVSLPGEAPSPSRPPAGCAFHPRCARATLRCRTETPLLTASASGHAVACHLPDEA